MDDRSHQADNLSPDEKRKLLRQLLLARADRPKQFPLSYAQQRLWVLAQFAPDSVAYTLPLAFRLDGPPDVAALEASLTALAERHSVLRTTFVMVAGQPIQQIKPPGPLPLILVDLQHLPALDQPAGLRQAISRVMNQPFDLAHGPLVRAALFRLAPAAHMLLITMDHLVSDGWSMSILVQELSSLYQAFHAGTRPSLPDLPLQYADYAIWQRQTLQGAVLERHLGFWREHLAGAPRVLELPCDAPRPAVQMFRGREQTFQVPSDLVAAAQALSQAENATMFMTMLVVFSVMLMRYTGQSDLLVGTPIANRQRVEHERLIGCFNNTLALRIELTGQPSFRTLLQWVRATCLEAYAHQDLPFERLVDALQPQRDPSRNPLVQVLFVVQNMPSAQLQLADLSVQPYDIHAEAAQLDLALAFQPSEANLTGWLQYNSDLFTADTMTRLTQHYLTLLRGALANPDQPVSTLPLLDPAEREQIMGWSQSPITYPPQRYVHEQIAAQAAYTPDAPALIFGDQRLTYRELDARANQLAHYLRGLDVGPEVRVGLCVERGLDMVIAMLAVLKSGGAYLPLDPNYPLDRLAFMLQDSRVPVLITQAHLRDLFVGAEQTIIRLDADQLLIAAQPRHAPPGQTPLDGLAYVLYTSGSTGKPKGVMISHRALANLFEFMVDEPGLESDAVLAAVTTISFDIAVVELLLPLTQGARIVLVARDTASDGARLRALLEATGTSVLQATPVTWRLLLEAGWQAAPGFTVLCGGETMPVDLAQRLLATGATVWNLYAPTETTVWSTFQRLSDSKVIPLGHPIANTQVYVLDRQLQPVPVGVVGDIYIGGMGVARGYLGRPELTAERFIPNPFAGGDGVLGIGYEGTSHYPIPDTPSPGARMYKTGDLARWQADGVLVYLGRTDHQIKLRGQRIELGEIEAALRQHAPVRQAVLLLREYRPGHMRLVAYVVPEPDVPFSAAAARQALQAHLPASMIPSGWVVLEALPLTPNGKIDRGALAADTRHTQSSDTPQPQVSELPRSATEQALAAMWADVLGRPQVGIYDNFFDLGGDSLLSIQAAARAAQRGLTITPRLLIQHQTVAELAAAVQQQQSNLAEQGPVVGPVPLLSTQQLFLDFAERNGINPNHRNLAVLLCSAEPLSPAALEQTVVALLAHHDALRMRFERDSAGWRQFSDPVAAGNSFGYHDLSGMAYDDQRQAIAQVTDQLHQSFDLAQGTLLRVALFHLGAGQPDRLLIVVHHLVFDGVSWGLLLEDLETAYRQASQGQPIALPPKTSSLKHWANRLSAYARSEAILGELPYWTDPARSHIPTLPQDRPGAATMESVGSVTLYLEPHETRALHQTLAIRYQAQIVDCLLTALVCSFAPWTGSDVCLMLVTGHGREDLFGDLNLARTIGWFTTNFPVLLRVAPTEPLPAALRSVAEQFRSLPSHGLGYGLLRYVRGDQQIAAALRDLPQPQLSFNYQGIVDRSTFSTALLTPAPEPPGPIHGRRGTRDILIQIDSAIDADRLGMFWRYSESIHNRSTIEALAQRCLALVRRFLPE